MTNAQDRRQAEDDLQGYANNPLFSPALNRLLGKLEGAVGDLTKPIDWQKAFEGVTVYYPK